VHRPDVFERPPAPVAACERRGVVLPWLSSGHVRASSALMDPITRTSSPRSTGSVGTAGCRWSSSPAGSARMTRPMST